MDENETKDVAPWGEEPAKRDDPGVKLLGLLIHEQRAVERWLQTNHPPIEAFDDSRSTRTLAELVRSRWAEHGVMLTRDAVQQYGERHLGKRNTIALVSSYATAYATRLAKLDDWPVYADALRAEWQQRGELAALQDYGRHRDGQRLIDAVARFQGRTRSLRTGRGRTGCSRRTRR